MTIPTNLIERALNLTGKTMEEMYWDSDKDQYLERIAIEKFYAFLLSSEFIEKYEEISPKNWGISKEWWYAEFWISIWEYQRKDEEFPDWNPWPLISLLEKIPWKTS